MPRAIILAGPNGAGKTTFAREYLPNEAGCVQFVNADLIAAGLSPFAPATADVAAGRAMIRRIDDLVSQGADFALESTLSGTWLVDRIKQWREVGYFVELYYLRLDSPETALRRVRQRVMEGGHDVPEQTVRRRYNRGLNLLEQVYKASADRWIVYDNSGSVPVVLSEALNHG